MFRKTLLASALALAGGSAFAADYYIVTPVPAKQAQLADIAVSLNAYSLPKGFRGRAYTAFDFRSILQVTGDPTYDSRNVLGVALLDRLLRVPGPHADDGALRVQG